MNENTRGEEKNEKIQARPRILRQAGGVARHQGAERESSQHAEESEKAHIAAVNRAASLGGKRDVLETAEVREVASAAPAEGSTKAEISGSRQRKQARTRSMTVC